MDLPLFPLNTVLFPGMPMPLHIFEPRYQRLINSVLASHQPFGIVLIRAGYEVGGPALPHPVGTTARITSVERLSGGRLNIDTVGHERFRVLHSRVEGDLVFAETEPYPLVEAEDDTDQRLADALRPWLTRYLEALAQVADGPFQPPALPSHPVALAYLAAVTAQAPPAEKQALLSAPTAAELLRLERALLRREIGLLRAFVARRAASQQQPGGFSPN
jgi:Lon protease-like protein